MSVIVLLAAATACGSQASDSASDTDQNSSATADRPRIVVTTNILGDIVSAAVGDQADVEVIMPLGTDPHDFAPSARQAESMEDADLLIVNGAGFEQGMLDIVANVSDTG
ncbi:MAG: zinc ABC transporter substrate-binding protein, partial [Ilumatobacter sp.]